MRVITGSARGRKLIAPPGLSTRPTLEMVKEAIFSIIQFELEGARILDLFAGSGQMGIEALSRGAQSCVFVDTDKESQQAIRRNLETTGFGLAAKISGTDAFSYLKGSTGEYDIAFLDPPYKKGALDTLLPAVAQRMSAGGVIVCETEKSEILPEPVGSFLLKKQYHYGKTKVTVYRMPEQE